MPASQANKLAIGLAKPIRDRYAECVEIVVQKFRSHAEAEQSEKDYYLSLTPEQRMEIFFELLKQGQTDEAEQGFARVYRIAKLHGS